MANTPLIEAKHLMKYFDTPRGKLHAVDDVSFTIERGTTMGVVGESGCGKSTLGRTMIHLLESTGGQILFNGEDITKVDKKKLHALREQMQIIFQDPYSSLNPRMTVFETVQEPLIRSKRYSKKEVEERAEVIMTTVGLDERLWNSYPHELDGGRRQRIGVARAIALDPSFIVCDEPVSALDVSIQAQILNLMQDLQEEKGLTYVHPFNDLTVATGQGTIAYEIFKDLPDVDIILMPIGGGGLAAGVSTLTKLLNPNVKVIGVEPVGAASMKAALEAGHPVTLPGVTTIADGVAVKTVGDKVFPYVQENVDEIITIEDDELVEVTPKSIRLRKKILNTDLRMKDMMRRRRALQQQ